MPKTKKINQIYFGSLKNKLYICRIKNKVNLENMNYRTKRRLVILADIICWGALLFFGYKYFTGC